MTPNIITDLEFLGLAALLALAFAIGVPDILDE